MKEKSANVFSVIFLSGFLVFLFCISNQANSQSKYIRVKAHPKFDQNFSNKVSVIDGDSIRVGDKEVRLVGIDAPEYHQTCFDEKKSEYACGQESHDFLVNLADKKEATCYYSGKDKYNRYLGKCFIGKVSINEEIIKNGMAVIYEFNNVDEKMEKLEAEAKSKKLGIWRGAFQLPKDYRKEHPRADH